MTRLELKTLAKAQINGNLVTLIFCSIIIAIINKVLISTTMIVGPIILIIIAPAFLLIQCRFIYFRKIQIFRLRKR